MIVRILQKIVYPTLKGLVRLVFFIFFKETTILHPERLNFQGPTLLVSNHPNTLLDPLNVASRIPRRAYFLANAGLFKSAIGNWFFNTFYCIPIERPKDVNGKRIQNDQAFARCDEFLSGGGCLYIAPQGGSDMVRRVGKLKTGTARIGLSAESNNGFQLGLKIVPVGLNYSNPLKFRENVLLHVGEAIEISDYQDDFLKDGFLAAKKITTDLEESFSDLIIDTEDEAENQLLATLERIAKTDHSYSPKQAYAHAQATLHKIKIVRKNDPLHFDQLHQKAAIYQERIKRFHLTDEAVARPITSVSKMLGLLLGFPFFLYGWVNNFLAAYIPAFVAKNAGLYIGYTATIKIMLGLFTFPIFYGVQAWLLSLLGLPTWALIIYLISLPPLGLFAWNYLEQHNSWRAQQVAVRLKAKASAAFTELQETRKILQAFGV